MKLIHLIFILFLNFIFLKTDAQFRLKGGEISIIRAGIQYHAKVYLLIDWPAVATKPYITIDWGDGSAPEQLPYSGSDCTYEDASNLLYTGSHTFTPNGSYTVTVVDSFFIPGIVNIPNSSSQKLVLRQVISNNSQLMNSPVYFLGLGCLSGGTACDATMFSRSQGTIDEDTDSLGFSIVGHPDIPGYVIPPAIVSTGGSLSFSTNVSPGYYNIRLRIDEWRRRTLTDPPEIIGTNFRDFILKVDACTGVTPNERRDSKVRVYPNPVTDKLNIEFEETETAMIKISISNSLGHVVYYSEDQVGRKELDLNFLSYGIYYLKIEAISGNKAQQVFKVVKE